jgi:hypothetical protein
MNTVGIAAEKLKTNAPKKDPASLAGHSFAVSISKLTRLL